MKPRLPESFEDLSLMKMVYTTQFSLVLSTDTYQKECEKLYQECQDKYQQLNSLNYVPNAKQAQKELHESFQSILRKIADIEAFFIDILEYRKAIDTYSASDFEKQKINKNDLLEDLDSVEQTQNQATHSFANIKNFQTNLDSLKSKLKQQEENAKQQAKQDKLAEQQRNKKAKELEKQQQEALKRKMELEKLEASAQKIPGQLDNAYNTAVTLHKKLNTVVKTATTCQQQGVNIPGLNPQLTKIEQELSNITHLMSQLKDEVPPENPLADDLLGHAQPSLRFSQDDANVDLSVNSSVNERNKIKLTG